MTEKQKTSVQLTAEGYNWLWDERKPGESMKRAFDRLRVELVGLRGGVGGAQGDSP